MDTENMTSSRPYFIRAVYQWLVDNALTPLVVVDAGLPGVTVPSQHIQEGRIVLNLDPSAVRSLSMENDSIHFNARFGGVGMHVQFPPAAVLAVYARENGMGMSFQEEFGALTPAAAATNETASAVVDDPGPAPPPAGKKPSLRIVK